jgi:hypothetical protein
MKFLGIMLMTTLLVGAPGYGSAEPPGKDSTSPATQPQNLETKREQARAVKSYTPEEKRAYQQKMAADLKIMQEKVDALNVKAKQVVQQKKRMALKAMISLQRQANAAKNTLAVLEKAPDQDWSRFKAQMDKAMEDLTTTYQEVEAHL